MPGFHTLDSRIASQRDKWLALWRSWPEREVFAHPAYVELFARPCDTPLCAVMDSPQGGILYPLILRPLAAEPWAKSPCTWCDLTTPYGYGGPFVWGRPDAAEFWTAFDSWTAAAHVVSCFARLALFPETIIPFAGTTEDRAPNVVRRLGLTPDALWMDYEHKVRKNVKRARRSGLRFEVDLEGNRLSEFLFVYHSTLERRNAEAMYYFPRAFFEHIVTELRGQFAFFHITKEDEVVSSELVLISAHNLYSYLGGTTAQALELRPNDLLKHEVAMWGTERSKKAYVLGGGYTPRDGIFRYKLSFAPKGEIAFKVGMRVYDPKRYGKLCDWRATWEKANGRRWMPPSGYFPTYRDPGQARLLPGSDRP
ncbi:MAG: GNAT family N-acetyltransferase [candidate division WOR-3 bacterium]|nr:MAG: GNAT family N-acetyltransferase [candidate division WOR-3 bacterium]